MDDGSTDQGLLILGVNGAIIALMFDNKRTTYGQVHENLLQLAIPGSVILTGSLQ
jgi:hypothetical protein